MLESGELRGKRALRDQITGTFFWCVPLSPDLQLLDRHVRLRPQKVKSNRHGIIAIGTPCVHGHTIIYDTCMMQKH